MENASAGIRGERLRNTPLGIKCGERKKIYILYHINKLWDKKIVLEGEIKRNIFLNS